MQQLYFRLDKTVLREGCWEKQLWIKSTFFSQNKGQSPNTNEGGEDNKESDATRPVRLMPQLSDVPQLTALQTTRTDGKVPRTEGAEMGTKCALASWLTVKIGFYWWDWGEEIRCYLLLQQEGTPLIWAVTSEGTCAEHIHNFGYFRIL